MKNATKIVAAAVLALAAGCAVNPATGRRQLSLIGERQEIEIGQENDRSIVAELGPYDDPALQEYVQRIGRSLAARSERPDLTWTFRVVDDPVVNAFALPGGFIYVTRGILAHLANEAQLASVLGHEIGHVTARHGVSQMSKTQVAQLTLGLGSILLPEQAQRFGQLASAGLGLLFLRFSREDERQADDLGLRYLVRDGYDPRPMAGVFSMLGRVSGSESKRLPGWMATHPLPENRAQYVQERIAATGVPPAGKVDDEAYLERIDGMVFGENPREGFFKTNRFLHPELQFRLDFPEGWKLTNTRQSVSGISPGQDAAIRFALASEATARAALEAFVSQPGVTAEGRAVSSIHGLPTAGHDFSVALEARTLRGRVAFVEYGGRVYQLLGYAAADRWPSYAPAVLRSLESFDRLTDPQALGVEPRRIEIVRPREAMSLETFASRHGASVDVETLARINQLDAGALLVAGRPYKIVQGGPLP